jgi:hypothetical protein
VSIGIVQQCFELAQLHLQLVVVDLEDLHTRLEAVFVLTEHFGLVQNLGF